jgi:hypothetical protein
MMSDTPRRSVRPRHAQPHSHSALRPGDLVGQDRYRLLDIVGHDRCCRAQLWRARDQVLGRDVALTVLLGAETDEHNDAQVVRARQQAAHTGLDDHSGTSRILDVLRIGDGLAPSEPVSAVVVAAWTPGWTLTDPAALGPRRPDEACRLLGPLGTAVADAHRFGLVLGVDHPQRMRITADGLRLAFPCPRAQATTRQDVAGLGAVLYLLLTGLWPLPGGPEDLPRAGLDAAGMAPAPHRHSPQVPDQLSALTMLSLPNNAGYAAPTSADFAHTLDKLIHARVVERRS